MKRIIIALILVLAFMILILAAGPVVGATKLIIGFGYGG